jgi:hypothetical protein
MEILGVKLLTPRQVAESGLISLVKQWQMRKTGELEYLRIGRKIFYKSEHIQKLFENSVVLVGRKSKVTSLESAKSNAAVVA